MNPIHLYLDEEALQDTLVQALQHSGADVMTVADTGRFSFSDEEQLIWATDTNGLSIVSTWEIFINCTVLSWPRGGITAALFWHRNSVIQLASNSGDC